MCGLQTKNCANISLLALGDISFMGPRADLPDLASLAAFLPLFSESDLVIANLESPLLDQGEALPGKCTLRGTKRWAKILRQAGIGFVSLANNHMMDYGTSGLFSTIHALDLAGIQHVGAGENIIQATAPVFVDIKGTRIALLARTCVEVAYPVNAGSDVPGVAFWDGEEIFSRIEECRQEADLVIVQVHWGLEHYHYPSPQQRRQARELASSGADIVLGHHPHVLQGMEMLGDSIVVYSLGNFLFDEFPWKIETGDEVRQFFVSMTMQNREAMALKIIRQQDGRIISIPVFSRIDKNAEAIPDPTPARQFSFDLLSRRLANPFYSYLWQLYAMKREWDLRLRQQLLPTRFIRKIYKIRPRHVAALARSLKKTAGIARGKSTNPYD